MLMISASVRILHIRCLVDFARTHLMVRLLRRRPSTLRGANTGQALSKARQTEEAALYVVGELLSPMHHGSQRGGEKKQDPHC
jgi:hypothetical protein